MISHINNGVENRIIPVRFFFKINNSQVYSHLRTEISFEKYNLPIFKNFFPCENESYDILFKVFWWCLTVYLKVTPKRPFKA